VYPLCTSRAVCHRPSGGTRIHEARDGKKSVGPEVSNASPVILGLSGDSDYVIEWKCHM